MDRVLLLTRGAFCASSWLAFMRLAVAAMADSCLAAEEEEMEAVFCEDSTWWDEEEVMAVLCLRSIEDASC